MAGFWEKLGGLFGRRQTPKPAPGPSAPPPLPGGRAPRGLQPPPIPTRLPGFEDHFPQGGQVGVAIGLGTKPNELNRRRLLPKDVGDFVYGQQVLIAHSSNVQAAQYILLDEVLIVKFLNKGKSGKSTFYQYDNVTVEEAISYATAQSKGIAVWDMLRVRGTKYGHKKPYHSVGGFRVPSTGQPQGMPALPWQEFPPPIPGR